MRHLFSIFLIYFIFCNSLIASSENIQKETLDLSFLTKEEKDWLALNPKIRIGVDQFYPPFEFINKSGNYSGIAADYLDLISKKLGITFVRVPDLSWSQVLSGVQNDVVDLLPVVSNTPERREFLNFTDQYIKFPKALIIRNDASEFLGYEKLGDKKIAIPAGYSDISILRNSFPNINIVETKTPYDGLKLVITGEVYGTFGNLAVLNYLMNENSLTNLKVSSVSEDLAQGHSFGVRKDWPELVSILQKTVDSLDRTEIQNIRSSWIGNQLQNDEIVFTQKELEWIDKAIPIEYVFDPDWAPFEWKNEIGEHTGIIRDVLDLVSKRTGLIFKEVPTQTWADAVELAENKDVDMYSGLGENEKRKKYMNFTKNVLYSTPYVFVVRADNKKDYFDTFDSLVSNEDIAVVEGYTIQGIMEDERPEVKISTVLTTMDGFTAVRNEEIDIFLVNAATARYYINQNDFDDLRISTKTEFSLELKSAIRKDWPLEVVSILDKGLGTISDEELSSIYQKWTNFNVKEKIDWELFYKVGIVVLVIFLLITYWNRRLNTLVNLKTEELETLLESFDSNVIALRMDVKGNITYVSDALTKVSGYEKEELLYEHYGKLMHKDMNNEFMVDMWKTLKDGNIWTGEIKNKKKDGGFYWVKATVSPMYNNNGILKGYSSIREDITAKKEVQELSKNLEKKVEERTYELKKSQENIEVILSNIMLPVLITSKDSRKIVYANEYASKQYETTVEELIGSSIDTVYTSLGQKNIILDAMKDKGYVESLEERYKTNSGKEFIGLLSVKPITYDSEDAFIGMVVDITEQKEIEAEIREVHRQTQSSIEYASLIQHSIIPTNDNFRKYFTDYFAIWHPKDIVGGDIYLFEELRDENECLVMVIDCTGHGVPGAFVTMLVKAIERQITAIISNNPEMEISPAWILQYFNKSMKKILRQDEDDAISNAGFDGAILYYNKKKNIVKFAGAELPLFYVSDGKLNIIRGSRHSVGYKKCDSDFEYKEHHIEIEDGMQFYLTSDGYLDQNGGHKGFPFGKKRFQNILNEYMNYTFADQQEVLLNELELYQGGEERNDDITLIGLKVTKNEVED